MKILKNSVLGGFGGSVVALLYRGGIDVSTEAGKTIPDEIKNLSQKDIKDVIEAGNLKRGDTGENVKAWQRILAVAMAGTDSNDYLKVKKASEGGAGSGNFGPATKRLTEVFQRKMEKTFNLNGREGQIDMDGKVGPEMVAILKFLVEQEATDGRTDLKESVEQNKKQDATNFVIDNKRFAITVDGMAKKLEGYSVTVKDKDVAVLSKGEGSIPFSLEGDWQKNIEEALIILNYKESSRSKKEKVVSKETKKIDKKPPVVAPVPPKARVVVEKQTPKTEKKQSPKVVEKKEAPVSIETKESTVTTKHRDNLIGKNAKEMEKSALRWSERKNIMNRFPQEVQDSIINQGSKTDRYRGTPEQNQALFNYLSGLSMSELARVVGRVSRTKATRAYTQTKRYVEGVHKDVLGGHSDARRSQALNDLGKSAKGYLESSKDHRDAHDFLYGEDGKGGVLGSMKDGIDGGTFEGGGAGWIHGLITNMAGKDTAHYKKAKALYESKNPGKSDFDHKWTNVILPQFKKECEKTAQRLGLDKFNNNLTHEKRLLLRDVVAAAFGYIVITNLKIPGLTKSSFALPSKQLLVREMLHKDFIANEERMLRELGNVHENMMLVGADSTKLRNAARYNKSVKELANAGERAKLNKQYERVLAQVRPILAKLKLDIDRDTLIVKAKGGETRDSLFNFWEKIFDGKAWKTKGILKGLVGKKLDAQKAKDLIRSVELFKKELIDDTGIDGTRDSRVGGPRLAPYGKKTVKTDMFIKLLNGKYSQISAKSLSPNSIRFSVSGATLTLTKKGGRAIITELTGNKSKYDAIFNALNKAMPRNLGSRSIHDYISVRLKPKDKGKYHNYAEYKDLAYSLSRLLNKHHQVSTFKDVYETKNPFAIAVKAFLNRFNSIDGYTSVEALYTIPKNVEGPLKRCFQKGCSANAVAELVKNPAAVQWLETISHMAGDKGARPEKYYKMVEQAGGGHKERKDGKYGPSFSPEATPQQVLEHVVGTGAFGRIMSQMSRFTKLGINKNQLATAILNGQQGRIDGFGDNTSSRTKNPRMEKLNYNGLNFTYPLPAEGIRVERGGKTFIITGHLNMALKHDCSNLELYAQGLNVREEDVKISALAGGTENARIALGILIGGSSGGSGGGESTKFDGVSGAQGGSSKFTVNLGGGGAGY